MSSGPSASIHLVGSIESSFCSDVTRIDHLGVRWQVCVLHFREPSVSWYSQTASDGLTAAEARRDPATFSPWVRPGENATASRHNAHYITVCTFMGATMNLSGNRCLDASIRLSLCVRLCSFFYTCGIQTWGSHSLPSWEYYYSMWRFKMKLG